MIDKADWWCFIDQQEQLNRQAPAQAVRIDTLKQALHLAKALQDAEQQQISELLKKATEGR